jgi:recombination protein RecA
MAKLKAKTNGKLTLDDLRTKIAKDHGEAALVSLGENPIGDLDRTSTGIIALDDILGGGLASGKVVEFYGTEGCLTGDTSIKYHFNDPNGKRINGKGGTIKRLYEKFHEVGVSGSGKYKRQSVEGSYYTVPSVNDDGRIIHCRLHDVIDSGIQECFEVKTQTGLSIKATANHPFKTVDGYVRLEDLNVGDSLFIHNNTRWTTESQPPSRRKYEWMVKHHPVAISKTINNIVYKRLPIHRAVYEAALNGLESQEYRDKLNSGNLDGLVFLDPFIDIHHLDENPQNNDISNLVAVGHAIHAKQHAHERHNNLRFMVVEDTIASIQSIGSHRTYDLKVEGPYSNFIANGFAVHNSGKTAIAMQTAGQAQKLGKVVLFDLEGAFNPETAAKAGVNVDDLFMAEAGGAEAVLQLIDDLLEASDVRLIIVDSVAGMVPRAELEGDYGDAHVGVMARLMSQSLRRLAGRMRETDTQATIIWINQLRDKIGGFGHGPTSTTPGGRALKFWSDVRLDVSRIGNVKKAEDIVGHTVRVKVTKNRTAPPFKTCEFDIIYETGISNEGTVLDLALRNGIVTQSGSWFADTESGEKLGQGKANVCKLFMENPDIMEAYIEKLNS